MARGKGDLGRVKIKVKAFENQRATTVYVLLLLEVRRTEEGPASWALNGIKD